MKVSEIMSKDPACCTPETRLQEVARMMVDRDCGEIPVVDSKDSQKPVGVITDRDITVRTVARGKNPLDLKASDVMTGSPVTVKPNTSVEECCDLMEEKQLRRVPVVDDKGCLCGIVAQADIARHATGRQTAEVVQEVSK